MPGPGPGPVPAVLILTTYEARPAIFLHELRDALAEREGAGAVELARGQAGADRGGGDDG